MYIMLWSSICIISWFFFIFLLDVLIDGCIMIPGLHLIRWVALWSGCNNWVRKCHFFPLWCLFWRISSFPFLESLSYCWAGKYSLVKLVSSTFCLSLYSVSWLFSFCKFFCICMFSFYFKPGLEIERKSMFLSTECTA